MEECAKLNTVLPLQLCAFCYSSSYAITVEDLGEDCKMLICTEVDHEKRGQRPLRNLCTQHPAAVPGQQHGMPPGVMMLNL